MFSWDLMECNLVDRYQHFRGTCCLHLQGRKAAVSPETSVPICPAIATQKIVLKVRFHCRVSDISRSLATVIIKCRQCFVNWKDYFNFCHLAMLLVIL
jgi:hypothetical protein